MTVDNLYDEIEFITESNSTTFTDVDKLVGINLDQGEALMMIMNAQGYRKVGEKTYYTDFKAQSGLVAGDSGYMGEYAFDSAWLKTTEFYVKFPNQGKYVKCGMYDVADNENSEFDAIEIDSVFSETKPQVRFARDSFCVRPYPDEDVSDGIKILAEPRQAALTLTTETPVMESNFHRWYVLKEALRFGKFREGISRYDITQELDSLEGKIRSYYSIRVKTPARIKTINDSFK